jgi:hypothetical protein
MTLRCRRSAITGCEQMQQAAPLLDHLVGAGKQCRWHGEAKGFGGDEVEDEVELGRLLDRNVGGLRAAQYFTDKVARTPVHVWGVCSVGHQPSTFELRSDAVHRRQPGNKRRGIDVIPLADHQPVDRDRECIRTARDRLERGRDIAGSPDFEWDHSKAKRASRQLESLPIPA